jgi:hypothetical protein
MIMTNKECPNGLIATINGGTTNTLVMDCNMDCKDDSRNNCNELCPFITLIIEKAYAHKHTLTKMD